MASLSTRRRVLGSARTSSAVRSTDEHRNSAIPTGWSTVGCPVQARILQVGGMARSTTYRTRNEPLRREPASRPGTTGNVIAALASFFVAGLGQLLQGRMLSALIWFTLAVTSWVLALVTLGLLGFVGTLVHILSCVHAATWRGD